MFTRKIFLTAGLVLGLFPLSTCFGQTHTVKLDWGASATPGVTYNVYRGNSPGAESTTALNSTPLSTLTFLDTSAGTSSCWIVKAQLGTLLSGPSNEVCVTYPSAPGTLIATPQ